MRKTIEQFSLLALSFFAVWFLLSRIDFMEIFKIEEMTRENEKKLGTVILESITEQNSVVDDDSVAAFVGRIKKQLCNANGIPDSSITVHIIVDDNVNAFALPDRHLIINTGLIDYCASADELSGVVAHEIGHMELHHVMKKMTKEIGLTMLGTIAGGESGGAIARQTAKYLSSTAFDREQESEADAAAVKYMAKAGIDPQGSANFLYRLAAEQRDIPRRFELLSTHPNSADRAAEILKLRKLQKFSSHPVADSASWKIFQEQVQANVDEDK